MNFLDAARALSGLTAVSWMDWDWVLDFAESNQNPTMEVQRR
jgi:hypothetical protein